MLTKDDESDSCFFMCPTSVFHCIIVASHSCTAKQQSASASFLTIFKIAITLFHLRYLYVSPQHCSYGAEIVKIKNLCNLLVLKDRRNIFAACEN